MALRIQAVARGRSAKATVARKAGKPLPGREAVPMTIDDTGCIHWEVTLQRRAECNVFGFSHSNGRAEFEKERGQPPDELGPECLFVRKVNRNGLLDEWNREHPDAEVVTGDRIVGVNGHTTVDSMKAATRGDRLALHVVRYAVNWDVVLEKRDDKKRLGFKFERPTNFSLPELRITEVSPDGLLEEWNASHASRGLHQLCVLPGMRVDKANDTEGDATELSRELMQCQAVTLRIRRMDVTAGAKEKLKQKMAVLKLFSPPPTGSRGGSQEAAR